MADIFDRERQGGGQARQVLNDGVQVNYPLHRSSDDPNSRSFSLVLFVIWYMPQFTGPSIQQQIYINCTCVSVY